jgi:hypothetical protein
MDQESVWPRPEEWPEPMWVDPRTDQCEICHKASCGCIHSACRVMPRIKDYGAKGRGLQAVACAPDRLAYREGDIIGELVAVLKPLQSQTDRWSVEVKEEICLWNPKFVKYTVEIRGIALDSVTTPAIHPPVSLV